MKKTYYLFISLTCFASVLKAQDKDAIRLDLLKAPSSPAAQLLGFAVSEIEKPTDLNSFMLTIQSASAAFSKVPNSYAIDLAPFSVIRGNKSVALTGRNSLQSKDLGAVIKQSMVVSFAFRNPDTAVVNFIPKNIYAALGINFSLIRQKFSQKHDSIINAITYNTRKLLSLANSGDSIMHNTLEYRSLTEKKITEIKRLREKYYYLLPLSFADSLKREETTVNSNLYNIEKAFTELMEESNIALEKSEEAKAIQARLKTLAGKFDAVRAGLSWDVAGGVGLNFRDKRFNNSKVYNSGVWTTIGYNSEKKGAILGVARLMMNPDQIYALDNAANPFTDDMHTFDVGGRYVYSKDKFSCSLEGIYRSILSSNAADPSWRLVLNTDYTIAPNQKLLFSFGRNFDGTVTKSNNLIASLSLLFGFGGTKISQ